MRHLEHTLQRNMVNLFRMAYPQYKGVFFAVPNGGHRDIRVAQHMKSEGQLAGVSVINTDYRKSVKRYVEQIKQRLNGTEIK